jgi:hypothetical protein
MTHPGEQIEVAGFFLFLLRLTPPTGQLTIKRGNFPGLYSGEFISKTIQTTVAKTAA